VVAKAVDEDVRVEKGLSHSSILVELFTGEPSEDASLPGGRLARRRAVGPALLV
jgi:hypothetical protein